MERKHLFGLMTLTFIVLTGCSMTNYYEIEEGLFCVDQNNNELCDKDEPEDVELDPSNLYEFETGKFCVDADDDEVCDDEETGEEDGNEITGNIVNNSTDTTINNSSESSETTKTDHELCLEKYDVEPGTLIFRYASWNPFFDDSYIEELEEAGFEVHRDKIGTDAKETYGATDLMKDCFSGKYSTTDFLPPEYICSSNQDRLNERYPVYGEVRTFAHDCVNVDVI